MAQGDRPFRSDTHNPSLGTSRSPPAAVSRGKELSALVCSASEPTLGIFVSSIEGPGKIFDFDKLPEQGCSRIVPAVAKKISSRGDKLASDAEKEEDSYDLIAAMARL